MTQRSLRTVRHEEPIDILPEDSVHAIREATFRVLETTGVEIRSERLLKELEKAGAIADHDQGHARFNRETVEACLALVPDDLPLSSREPGLDLHFDGKTGFLGVDGSAAEIVDLHTGNRRASLKSDLADITKIADSLPQISYIWQPVASRDVPVPTEPMHNLEAQLPNTGKHIMLMTAVTGEQAHACSEMASVAMGGEQALKDRPIISAFQCSVSPLVYDGGPLEAAVAFAEHGVPNGFMVMPISGATSPITRAGTLVISNAEIIAGVVCQQLLAPGARTFYGSCATTMDLRSGAANCGGPEDLLYQMANAQLARSYGLRSIVGTFATGSKTSDWQGGAENGASAMASSIAGADMLSGAGLLYAARVFSAVQMLLDCELFDMVAGAFDPMLCDAETLAVEVIEAVGPGNHFLDQDHTLDHMRELWMSDFFSRESWEDWEAGGKIEPKVKAQKKALEILETHRPYPMPDGAEDEIRKIVAAHEPAEA